MMLWNVSLLGTNSLKKNRPCDIACWNHSHKNSNVPCSVIYDYSGTNDVTHYGGTEIVDIILIKLILFIADKLLITHVILSHPITRTKSKHLAMKTEDIQPHLRKLQIDMIENGSIMD